MQTRNPMTLTLPSDREVVLTRVFDAPRALVFEALSKPEHVAQWWGPRRCTMSTCEMDFRPGGTWRLVLRDAEGNEFPFTGVYREITPPERVVQTFIFDVPPFNEHESVETMTLAEQDGRTILTTRSLYGSKEARDGHIQSGMESGAAETYDRLEEYVQTLAEYVQTLA